MAESDYLFNSNDNVELEDMVVPDSSNNLSEVDSDIEVGNHGSLDSNRKCRAIDKAMERRPFSIGVDGKVRFVKDMLFNNVNHFREVFLIMSFKKG